MLRFHGRRRNVLIRIHSGTGYSGFVSYRRSARDLEGDLGEEGSLLLVPHRSLPAAARRDGLDPGEPKGARLQMVNI